MNITRFEDAIIASGDAKYIFELANCLLRNYLRGNISELIDAIIASGNAEYICKVARIFPNANILKLTDALIASGDAKYICELAEYLVAIRPSADIERLVKNLIILGKAEEVIDLYSRRECDPFVGSKDVAIDSDTFIDDQYLVLLSLLKSNVLLSTISDNEEVTENVPLYLDMLKELDPIKYYCYRDAFLGKISFDRADDYYRYDYHQHSLTHKK